MNIKYLFWNFVIILFLINCNSILSTEENIEESDENDDNNLDDRLDVIFTKIIVEKFSALYNTLTNNKAEESGGKLNLPLRFIKSSGFYGNRLFQGDIILTTDDAKAFLNTVKEEVKNNYRKISKIVSDIESLIKTNEILAKVIWYMY
uniref:Uncharacterized protein n=1 Tax=Strongyloides venezuelensis TaxID=75913 RepID=A0A0K0F1V0_STRVS